VVNLEYNNPSGSEDWVTIRQNLHSPPKTSESSTGRAPQAWPCSIRDWARPVVRQAHHPERSRRGIQKITSKSSIPGSRLAFRSAGLGRDDELRLNPFGRGLCYYHILAKRASQSSPIDQAIRFCGRPAIMAKQVEPVPSRQPSGPPHNHRPSQKAFLLLLFSPQPYSPSSFGPLPLAVLPQLPL
jgi:hypothetical protein